MADLRLERQEHAAHGRRIDRVPRPRARRQPDGAVQRRVCDVDDVDLVENGDRRAAAELVDDILEKRLEDDFRVDRAQVSGTDGQDFRAEKKSPTASPDVAERFERVQRSSRRGRRQLGKGRDLAQRELRDAPGKTSAARAGPARGRRRTRPSCFSPCEVAAIIAGSAAACADRAGITGVVVFE